MILPPALLLLLLVAPIRLKAQKPELVVQTGHSQSVAAVAYSPDGRTIASGGRDGMVKLWDVATGKELRTLAGHSSVVNSVVFSPDSKWLASAGEDKTVRLWDATTGETLRTWGHEKTVDGVAFSPDGRRLASGSADATIKLWDTTTGAELRTLQNNTFVNAVAFSPDGQLIATGDRAHDVKLWDAATGNLLRTLEGHDKEVEAVAFSPDGKTIASAATDGTVRLWRAATGREVKTLKGGDSNFVYSVAFSSDGKTLASGHGDGAVRLWDARTGRELHALRGDSKTKIGSHPYYSVAISPDNKQLAGASNNHTIRRWEMATGDELPTLPGQSRVVAEVAFAPEGKRLVISDGALKIWDVTTGTELRAMTERVEFARSVAISPDGKTLATASNDKTVRLFDAATGTELRKMPGHPGTEQSVAFSPDGKLFASMADNYTIKLWDTTTGAELRMLQGQRDLGGITTSIAFSPDSRQLASACYDNTMKLWDIATGAQLRTLTGHSSFLLSVAFSPDGRQIASSSIDKTVKLWDAATGAVLRTLTGHSDMVCSVSFSPDGKLLASASRDNLIKLWDAESGAEVRTLRGHGSDVLSVAFSPDGTQLISSSYDGTTKIWDPSGGKELASLIVIDETDWLVVTPEGFFDGSPGSWKQTIWRFNNDTFNFAPVESFFGEFYYPGLLQDVLEGKSPALPVDKDLARIDRRQPMVSITQVEQRAAPAKRRPLNRAAAHGEREVMLAVDIEANASRPRQANHPATSGAQDVRLFRNGSLVKVWRGDMFTRRGTDGCAPLPARRAGATNRVRCRIEVPVVAGTNEFMAYAFNHANVKSDDAMLTLTGAESLRRPATLHVLAFGVNKYENERFNLSYAVADAEGFAGEMKRQQEALRNFTHTRITLLLNAEATKLNILSALAKLAQTAQPEDTIAIYFAGHGMAHQNQFYLLPHDLGYAGERTRIAPEDLQELLRHSVSDRELEQVLERADAGQSLLVIDACNSGQALEAEEKRRGPMNSKGLAQLAYEKGMYVLTAAQSFQAAQEVSKLGHGLLTYVLIEEGLKQGAADTEPKDNNVLLREWLNYATRRVPEVQVQEVQRAAVERGVNLSFADDERGLNIKNPAARGAGQRPRVFYRREVERRPLVVAARP